MTEFIYIGQKKRIPCCVVLSLSNLCQCVHVYAAATKAFDAALRCVFGTEAVHMSLLYFLTYISAAGGLDPLLSCREKLGGQEFKIVVRFFATSVYSYY